MQHDHPQMLVAEFRDVRGQEQFRPQQTDDRRMWNAVEYQHGNLRANAGRSATLIPQGLQPRIVAGETILQTAAKQYVDDDGP